MRGHCPWGKKCDRIHPPKSAPSATEAPQALTNPSTSKLVSHTLCSCADLKLIRAVYAVSTSYRTSQAEGIMP